MSSPLFIFLPSACLLQVDPLRLARLDAVTSAPAWLPASPRPPQPYSLTLPVPSGPASKPQPSESASASSSALPFEVQERYRRLVSRVAQALIAAKDRLNELDGKCGDGDCGLTLARGAEEVRRVGRWKGVTRCSVGGP